MYHQYMLSMDVYFAWILNGWGHTQTWFDITTRIDDILCSAMLKKRLRKSVCVCFFFGLLWVCNPHRYQDGYFPTSMYNSLLREALELSLPVHLLLISSIQTNERQTENWHSISVADYSGGGKGVGRRGPRCMKKMNRIWKIRGPAGAQIHREKIEFQPSRSSTEH